MNIPSVNTQQSVSTNTTPFDAMTWYFKYMYSRWHNGANTAYNLVLPQLSASFEPRNNENILELIFNIRSGLANCVCAHSSLAAAVFVPLSCKYIV